MSGETLLAFSLAMFLLAAVAGAGLSHGGGAGADRGLLPRGWRPSPGWCWGTSSSWCSRRILGLSALAAVMGEFFLAVKILGAAYLIWLGREDLAQPARACRRNGCAQTCTAEAKLPHHRSAALGFFVTLGNPKAILFYGALLPTFIERRRR